MTIRVGRTRSLVYRLVSLLIADHSVLVLSGASHLSAVLPYRGMMRRIRLDLQPMSDILLAFVFASVYVVCMCMCVCVCACVCECVYNAMRARDQGTMEER